MVKVNVGGMEKDGNDVDQQWLCRMINGRRRDGLSDCVRVRIEGDNIDLAMVTPGCARGGGCRELTRREVGIVDVWRKLGLDQPGFSCGNVHAFLVQLRRLV